MLDEIWTYLGVGVQGQLVSVEAQLVSPDVAGHSAEDAHSYLEDNDKSNLEVQKMIVRACKGGRF